METIRGFPGSNKEADQDPSMHGITDQEPDRREGDPQGRFQGKRLPKPGPAFPETPPMETRRVKVIGVGAERYYSATARAHVWQEVIKVREEGSGPIEAIPFETRTRVVALRQ